MGQAFSHTFPDESLDIISPQDRYSEAVLAVCWAGSLYAIAMLFTALQLVDRWRGPRDDIPTGFSSVLGAFVLSTAWPVVLVVLAMSGE